MPTTLPEVAVATAPGTPVVIALPAVAAGDAVLAGYGAPVAGTLALNPDQSLTYAPAAGFRGADGFAYTVQAVATGALLEGRVAILVNTAPLTGDDAAATTAGAAVLVPVLANDGDPDGDPLAIAAVVMSGHGTVAVEPDGRRLRYVPQTGFVGRDSFAYTVSDGRGGSATATVSVAVETANRPPAARDDAAAATAGTPVVVPVLANDSDPDGDPLALAGLTMPAYGTLAANPDRTVTYTPAPGRVGADEFAYTVTDGRGGFASARVAVEVSRPNADPVAVPDQATTAAGTPVTIPVLANDSDPDGDPLALAALSLPAHGALAVNPDRTVTYTPAPGHVGADEFAYTVADGWGGTATARVSVAVERPAQPAFANGHLYRRRLVVPAAAVATGDHQGFPLRVGLRGAWLKARAAGGRMESAQGFDLRFEAEDGTLLPHEVEAYDAAAGALEAWVRLPRLSAAAGARLFLYYGKPGQAASAADPAALWGDYLAVWHLPASAAGGAADSGRAGRGLAAAGAVAGDAGGLAGSVRLAGAGTLGRGDAAFLDGLPALTVQLRAKADATGHERGLVNLGGFGDAGSAFTLRYAGAGGALHARLRTTAGDATVTTEGGAQGTGWQALALAWASGDPRPSLHLDGIELEAAQGSALPAGAAATDLLGPLTLGAGARDSAAGGWRGLLDEVRIRPGRLPAAWLAAEHVNHASPEAFFGTGPEDAPEGAPGAVAVPVAVAAEGDQHVDVDVLARAFVPAGAAAPTISSVGQPAHGTATAIGGKVRYTPAAGYAGPDSFTYAIVSGGKESVARITVAVAEAAGSEELPTPRRVVPVSNAGGLTRALAEARPGDHIELADGPYAGNFATTGLAGTAADPVVVRAKNKGGAVLTGRVTLSKADSWLWGLRFPGQGGTDPVVSVQADRCRVLRCRFHDVTAPVCINVSRCLDGKFGYNEFLRYKEGAIWLAAVSDGTLARCLVHRNLLKDQTGAGVGVGMYAGTGKDDSERENLGTFEYNLIYDHDNNNCIELKSSRNTVRFNTLIGVRRTANINVRHGYDNRIIANHVERGGIVVRDYRSYVAGNRLVSSRDGLVVYAGNITPEQLRDHTSGYPNAIDTRLIKNTSDQTTIGGTNGWVPIHKAKRTALEAHVGPVTEPAAEGTTRSPTTAEQVPAAVRLTEGDVGPNAP